MFGTIEAPPFLIACLISLDLSVPDAINVYRVECDVSGVTMRVNDCGFGGVPPHYDQPPLVAGLTEDHWRVWRHRTDHSDGI